MSVAEIYRRGLTGWPPGFPVAQAPNAPLLVALAGRGLAVVADRQGRSRDLGDALFVLGLCVWAWKEATSGVNWFRRLLGIAGLVAALSAAREQTSGRRRRASP